ncbi:MAG: thioredoxin family protein [Chloroflexi bacterium]|nr:thioredoxin family protein [Chloroflexota bacterium]
MAHKMAMESEFITADMVDASEFAELSDSYQVYGVPLTVANDKVRVEGGMPEQMFVPQILQKFGVSVKTPGQ